MKMITLSGNPNLVNPGFNNPSDNPLDLLQIWLDKADDLKIIEPRGLVLSTVDTVGKPSSRVVLLRTLDEKGIIFASSETSQKGKDLKSNPIASGTLWWRETMQQINFYGRVTKLSAAISDQIFKERTREAQSLAAVSSQSSPMQDEEYLHEAFVKLTKQPEAIIRPKTWHAYHLAIESIEFWLGSKDRFHNRLRYNLDNEVWLYQKLQP